MLIHTYQQNRTKANNENTTKQNPEHQFSSQTQVGSGYKENSYIHRFMHTHVGARTHCQSPSVICLPTVPGGKKREIQLALSATCLGSSWDRLKPQGYNSSFALRVETFLFLLPGIFRQKKTTPDKSTSSSLPSLLPSLLLLFL